MTGFYLSEETNEKLRLSVGENKELLINEKETITNVISMFLDDFLQNFSAYKKDIEDMPKKKTVSFNKKVLERLDKTILYNPETLKNRSFTINNLLYIYLDKYIAFKKGTNMSNKKIEGRMNEEIKVANTNEEIENVKKTNKNIITNDDIEFTPDMFDGM